MARKELVFTEGEFGFNHTFNVEDEDGNALNLTPYNGVRLVIADPNDLSDVKLDITSNLSIGATSIIWAVQSGQTDFSGNLIATIHLTNTGVLEKVQQFQVVANPKVI